MTDSTILETLAALNPVIDEPGYDEDAERALVALLETARAQAAPVRARPTAGRRRTRLPGWGATMTVAATLALALVVVVGGISGRDALHPRPAAPPVTHVDSVADRVIAALGAADNYIVRGDEIQTDASGVAYRSVTSTDERSAVNFASVEYSASGVPVVSETDFAVGAGVTVVALDHRLRQYSLTRLTMLQYARRFGFTSVAELDRSSLPTSQQIRRDLLRGSDRLLGRAVLHGRRVLVLANDEPSLHRRIWVDPATYLPLRMTAHGQGVSYVINYTWIQRTRQAVAATFAPHIPTGFTKVSRLAGA